MMVVLAVIGIVAASFRQIDLKASREISNRERLVATIFNTVARARTRQLVGEPVPGFTGSIVTTQLYITSTGITERFFNGTGFVATGQILTSPYFDNDVGYRISRVYSYSLTGAVREPSAATGIVIIFSPEKTSFAPPYQNDVRLRIDMAYISRTGAILFDRRTGSLERLLQ